MVYNLIVCGGTFDHFHKGHSNFLKFACSVGKKLIIGVTSDEFAGRLKIEDRGWSKIEPFEGRKQSILELIKSEGALNKVEIIEINDLFGPTLAKDLPIDAIVVSDDTKQGAEVINEKRKELGLNPLKVLIASSVAAQDGKPISSAGIRNGEINREGEFYIKQSWLKTDLALPQNLRQEFEKPFGELRQEPNLESERSPYIITVGDATTKKFNEIPIKQNISVVDFKIARKEVFSSFSDLGFSKEETIIIVNNPAGHITRNLFLKILDIFKPEFNKRVILKIEGEEDLAVLPLILAAPLDTIIYYGQPNVGLVKILVSEGSKDKAYNLISKFKPI